MAAEQFEITAGDGVVVRGFRWMPDGEPHAVVQVSHGMAEHSARYARFAEELTADGYAVYAHDHRGHGRTADGGVLGHFADDDGWARAVADLREVTLRIQAEVPGRPIVMLGHSMGSLLARTFAAQHGEMLAGLILSGTPADPGLLGRIGRQVARAEGRLRGRTHASKLLDTMSFGAFNKKFKPTRTDFDWLSRDAAAVDAYIADPLCGFVCSDAFYADMLGGLRLVNSRSFVAGTPSDLPVLVISGDADPAGDDGDGVRPVADLLRGVGVRDVTLTLYPQARHEILNETNRDEVVADILGWLDAHV